MNADHRVCTEMLHVNIYRGVLGSNDAAFESKFRIACSISRGSASWTTDRTVAVQ